MNKLLKSLGAVMLALSLTACGGNDTPSDNNDSEYKDTILWGISNDQDSLDPATNVSNNVVLPQIYSTLIKIDQNGAIAPDLATEWSVGEDGLTWTFNLREDVKFQNGKQLTSADVVATFDRLLNEDDPYRYTSEYTSFVESVTAPDEYTVVVKTKTPYGAFEAKMASVATGILDSDYIEQYGHDLGKTPESVNGSGPYKVTDWSMGEQMVFEAFDDYFGGKPKTKNIIMQVIPEQNSRAIAVETGQMDIVSGLAPDDVVRFNNGEVDGVTVSMNASNGMHLFQFNCAGVLQDVKLRQAISYGIDRQTIVDTLYAAIGETPALAPVTPNVVDYSELGMIEYDPERAKELLKEAGYEDGLTINVMTTAVYNKGIEMAEIISEQLKQIGITVNIETVEKAVFTASWGVTPDQFKWDMFIMGAGGSSDVGNALTRVWHTEEGGKNVNNYGWYSNKEVDALLDEGAVTTDPEARKEIYKKAMQIIWEDDPVGVFMNYRNNIYGLSTKVEGFHVNPGNTPDMMNFTCKK